MAYLIDRGRALLADEVVVIVNRRERRRSDVVCRDNSLYQTRTRPGTLARSLRANGAVSWVGARPTRTPGGATRHIPWQRQRTR